MLQDLTDTKLQINVERNVHYEVEEQGIRIRQGTEDLTAVGPGSDIKLETMRIGRARQGEHKSMYSTGSHSGGSSPVSWLDVSPHTRYTLDWLDGVYQQ
jgi:hypothetical protein